VPGTQPRPPEPRPWSLGAAGRGEGSAGGSSGPGKCLSPRRGFATAAWKNFGGGFFSCCWEEEQAEKPGSPASQRGRAGAAGGSGSSEMLPATPCPCGVFGSPRGRIHEDGEPSYKEWAALHRSFISSWGA